MAGVRTTAIQICVHSCRALCICVLFHIMCRLCQRFVAGVVLPLVVRVTLCVPAFHATVHYSNSTFLGDAFVVV